MYTGMLREYGIGDLIELAPPVSYRLALQEMLCADGLLLIQASMCNHQIPAKLYEYLRAGRPIVALTDPVGNTADALRASGADTIFDIADEADIARGLRKFLPVLRTGELSGIPRQVADLHSRHSRTAELAQLLAGLTS